MAYLTFYEYKNMGGTAITDVLVFERYLARASALINRMTHGRIIDESPVRSAVKNAVFDIISVIHTDTLNGADGREVASMSNDGMSVTYVPGASNSAAATAMRYATIVRQYLEWETDANGTPLLYMGVDA
jgi:hypothetical protein